MTKIGFSFHETLKLRRANLSQVLECFANGIYDQEGLRRNTSLGTNEVKSAPGYLRGAGLLGWEKELTGFGKLAHVYDPTLSQTATQWLMHYHFVAPHWYGPKYWELLSRHLMMVDPLSNDKLSSLVAEFIQEDEHREISASTIRASTNVFLRSYSEVDGFATLKIISESEETSDFTAGVPVEIPWCVFAYILADFWEANWGISLSVPYADLSNDTGPGALLFLNSGQIGQLLRPMQEAGLIEVSRVSRPWTVLRKWENKEALLEAVYTDDSTE